MESYKNLFKTLHNQRIRYIVVGGVAMSFHGITRFTNDIDILLALDDENRTKMNAVMKELGYEQRLPVSLDELGDEKRALQLINKKNLLAYSFVHPKNPLISVDIIVGPSLKFEQYAKHMKTITLWGIEIPVVSIEDLIELKRDANREKDHLDIEMLLSCKHL